MDEDGSQRESRSDSNPLHDLNLDTAIRLRWVLRDIRAGRVKLTAPASDDLALLGQRGLITMDNGQPILTDAANSVIR
nr:hypothetical protein [Nitrobacter hamburgensis]